MSLVFIGLFLVLLILEALLGTYVYNFTGEISSLLIVIMVFVLYACTFGIFDFIRLDRWMRMKIGKWRGVELLNQKDYDVILKSKDPKYIARKYRRSSIIHLVFFVIGQGVFWGLGTDSLAEIRLYITDFSWLNEDSYHHTPYSNETLYSIGIIWGVVFIVDFLYSWSYTFSPGRTASK
nr:hypothetical protein [Jeotgalibacillus terrae]